MFPSNIACKLQSLLVFRQQNGTVHATASLAVNLAQHVIHMLADIVRMGVESEIGAKLLDQLQWFVADVD